MTDINRLLTAYAKIAHTLPKPKDLPLLEAKEYCACGKVVPITKFYKINTGAKIILNNVCSDCPNGKKLDAETAKLVCCKCGRVVLRLQPGKDAIDGFVIKPGMSLHLAECSNCDGSSVDEKREYIIIEKAIWQKKQNKTIKTTKNIAN